MALQFFLAFMNAAFAVDEVFALAPAPPLVLGDEPEEPFQEEDPIELGDGEQILYWPRGSANGIGADIDVLAAFDRVDKGGRLARRNPRRFSLRARIEGAFANGNVDDRKFALGAAMLGGRYLFTPRIAGGFYVMATTRNSSSQALNTTVNGRDLGISANLVARIGKQSTLTGFGYYINGLNNGNVGGVTDTFTTHQYGVGAEFASRFVVGPADAPLSITPAAMIGYAARTRDASTASDATAVPGLVNSGLQASASVAVAKGMPIDFGMFDAAVFKAKVGISYRTASTPVTIGGQGYLTGGVSGDFSAGVDMIGRGGSRLGVEVGYHGIGSPFSVWRVNATLRMLLGGN